MKRGSRTNPEQLDSPLRVSPKDVEIFKFIFRHTQARSNHIAEYIGGSQGNVLNRLLDYRRKQPNCVYTPNTQWAYGKASRRFIYRLTADALRILEREDYLNPHNEWVMEKHGDGRNPWLSLHDLMVSDFSSLLDIALKGKDATLYSWKEILERSKRTDKNPLRLPVDLTFGDYTPAKTSVTPDYFFSLESGGQFHCYAVEANLKVEIKRKDLKEPSTLKKFLGYMQLIENQALNTHFGMKQPLYLISIYNDARKMARSMALLEEAVPKELRGRFLFLCDPGLGDPGTSPARISMTFKRVGYPDFTLLKGGELRGRTTTGAERSTGATL